MTPNLKLATKLRTQADTLQKAIDTKRDPRIAHQNLTPRRIRIARHMAAEADRLELVQRMLRRLADCHEHDDWSAVLPAVDHAYRAGALKQPGVASVLVKVRTRGDLENLWTESLRALVGTVEQSLHTQIRRMEEDLVGLKIPGFFPTPAETADLMVELLGITPGDRVLEPSAGKGDLIEAILRRHRQTDVAIEWCEVSGTLRDVLWAKFPLLLCAQDDFMDLSVLSRRYERILMNPPFEKGLDMIHTRRAWEHLVPGGRLVGIVSEGCFFRETRPHADFRAFLQEHQEREPIRLDGAFKGIQAFRQTGVNARIVVLDKPGEAHGTTN